DTSDRNLRKLSNMARTLARATLHVVCAKSRGAGMNGEVWRPLLLPRLFAQGGLEHFEIVLDVGVVGIARLRLEQDLAGAALVAAQHIGVTAIVENFCCGSGDLCRLIVGAVGEIEAALPVVAGGKPDPGFEIARMQLDGAAEVPLGQTEVPGAEVLLAKADIVIGG